jgi:hypothetical protein
LQSAEDVLQRSVIDLSGAARLSLLLLLDRNELIQLLHALAPAFATRLPLHLWGVVLSAASGPRALPVIVQCIVLLLRRHCLGSESR